MTVDVHLNDQNIERFLDFLSQDILNNPQQLKPISPDFVVHVQSLVADVECDLEAPLLPEDD